LNSIEYPLFLSKKFSYTVYLMYMILKTKITQHNSLLELQFNFLAQNILATHHQSPTHRRPIRSYSPKSLGFPLLPGTRLHLHADSPPTPWASVLPRRSGRPSPVSPAAARSGRRAQKVPAPPHRLLAAHPISPPRRPPAPATRARAAGAPCRRRSAAQAGR